jgi:hypothetical protein
MVTDLQVRLMRRKLREGKNQEAAAAASGMSVRSARRWHRGKLPSQVDQPRHWRTRKDPFAGVWDQEVVPLLESDKHGELQATTILEFLDERYPGRFVPAQLRTLQRRMRDWRALYGPDKEVYFEQVHPPGREAAVDFTHATSLGVTIQGQLLRHLLFLFRLSFSKWTWVDIAFGETYEALVAGVQGAAWELGGVPAVLRSDNLSAATHELRRSGGRALTQRFKAVLDHYGMESTRIRPGKSHENGIAEKAHDLLKSALAQALVLRGSKDFLSVDAYLDFVREVIERTHNRHLTDRLAEEMRFLKPLPSSRVPSYTVHRPKVRRWSTIRVAGRTYSVPSRLKGHEVEARLHPDVLEVRYNDRVVETMPRLRGERDHRIDYRHVIWSLVRKPGAFARYRFREDLFPTMTFRLAYDALRRYRGQRADVEYVRVLHLAASTMESQVETALDELLGRDESFDYAAVRAVVTPERPSVPEIRIGTPDLGIYDQLIAEAGR